MPTEVDTVDAGRANRKMIANGKTWNFKPLGIPEWAEVIKWLRDEHINFVKRHVRDVREELSDRLIAEAISRAETMDASGRELAARLNDPMGLLKWAEISLRPNHPDITEEQVRSIFNSEEFLEGVRAIMDELEYEDDGTKKKKKKRKTGTKAQKRPQAKLRKKRSR